MVTLPIEPLGQAAYEAHVAQNPRQKPWSELSDPVRAHWGHVARAVMAKAAERP